MRKIMSSILRHSKKALELGMLLLILLAGGYSTEAVASHSRYGQLTWKPTTTPMTIEFTFTSGWRRSYGSFDHPNVGDTLANEFYIDFGDGDGSGGSNGAYIPSATVTAIDGDNDWFLATGTVTHTYLEAGNYTAFFDGCCRIGDRSPNEHINNPSDSFRIEAGVNIAVAGQVQNSSPISSLPPIVFCPQEGICSFTVPAADPDHGDTLSFRLATSAEATGNVSGFVQPGPPNAPNAAGIDPASGRYTWDTTGATLTQQEGYNTLYSSQVIIEDSGGSKVALDFLIQLVPSVGVPPVFNPQQTANCGSSITATIGQQLTFSIETSDPDASQTVSLNAAGLPVGATMNPSLPVTNNPVSSTFYWTPTENARSIITFTATDNFNQQSLCSIGVGTFLTITTNALPSAPTGRTYNATIEATGGDPGEGGYSWSIINRTVSGAVANEFPNYQGLLENNLAINPSTGELTWLNLPYLPENTNPADPLYYMDFTIKVTDSSADGEDTTTFRYTDPTEGINTSKSAGGGGGGGSVWWPGIFFLTITLAWRRKGRGTR